MLLVDGQDATVTSGDQVVYEIATRAADSLLGTELKVTLTWTDPPGTPISQNPIVNNLDLIVELNDGAPLYGNDNPTDAVNTVETVTIANAASSTVRVTVKGTNVPEGPQKFALVVTGPLSLISPPPAAPFPPPPLPPHPPPAPLGDVVVLGISLPLLVVALMAGGGFFFKRVKGGGASTSKALKPLPPGWKLLTDPSTGSPFYINESTGQRQWEPPAATAAPAKDDLPPGWHAQTDPNTGQTYYVNEKTSESQWDKPAGAGGAAALSTSKVAVPVGGGLPDGWQTGTDPASGRTYWFNPTTKASQWTPP